MDRAGNFTIVGKASELSLRENEVPVHHDFEDTVLAFDQLDLAPELRLQLGRQPGGPRAIVSNPAVFD